jgi:outer membrane lipoprotein-sorting protein
MKRIISILAALLCAVAALAQTPQEIISGMEEAMKVFEKDGEIGALSMTLDIKIPILGTMSSRSYILGDKLRVDAEVMGEKTITYTDGETSWTYTPSESKVVIENFDGTKKSNNQADVALFSGITDGYDVTIKRETSDTWQLLCKKSRTNTKKDDPKTMNLEVYKKDFLPKSLSASISGITVTMRDFSPDVTEKQVTFNPADYPGVTVVDNR